MDITDMRDEYIRTAESAMSALSAAQVPGRFWIEFLPALRLVPRWSPGAYFKSWAERYKPIIDRMVDQPFDVVKRDMVCRLLIGKNVQMVLTIVLRKSAGHAGPSVAVAMMEGIQADMNSEPGWSEKEEIARGVTGVAYGGKVEITFLSRRILMWFGTSAAADTVRWIHSLVLFFF